MARPTVILDLAGSHKLARDLVAGGVFVPGCTLGFNEDCELLVRAGETEIRVSARVVWVDGERGAGLQLIDCDADTKQRIAMLAKIMDPDSADNATNVLPSLGRVSRSRPVSRAPIGDAATQVGTGAAAAGPAPSASELDALAGSQAAVTDSELETELARTDVEEAALDAEEALAQATDDEADPERKHAPNMHERLRGLTLVQQVKLAHSGEVQERILLERMYSKNVWEALLRNPRLTGPEVARIARMGTLPRVLLEIIVNNGAWLQIPEVRRALLSNPRLGTDQILRVLRLMPKHELKLAPTQTAYPTAVRDAARKLIRDSG